MDFDFTTPSMWAINAAEPYFAGILAAISREHSCPAQWRRQLDWCNPDDHTVEACETLPPQYSWLDIVLATKTLLAEHTTRITVDSVLQAVDVHPGVSVGEVELDTSVHVRFQIDSGQLGQQQIGLESRNTVSDLFDLYDLRGQRCVRLKASAGVLWLRSAVTGHSSTFAHDVLSGNDLRPQQPQEVVITASSHAQVVSESLGHDQGPWLGLSAVDQSDRRWHVAKSQCQFTFGLSPAPWLGSSCLPPRQSSTYYLELPYQAVWLPVDHPDKYIELELS